MRRSLALIFALALCDLATVRGDDWPQWFGPKRDGVWRDKDILEKFPKEGPKLVFKNEIGAGYAGPAVAKGKIFIADRIIAGDSPLDKSGFARLSTNGSERFLCLDEATGKELWKCEFEAKYSISYGNGPRATPTVHGDHVYFLGAIGDLVCLEIASGKMIWKKNFVKDYEAAIPVWGFSSPPLVDGDKLICLVGGSGERFVIAFDLKTGKELWKAVSVSGDPGYGVPMIFEVGKTRQLIVWSPKAVHSLDPETGKVLWEEKWEIASALTAPTPQLIGKDMLFLSSFYNGSLLLKLDTEKPGASVVWKSKSKGNQAAVMPSNTLDLHSIMTTPFVVEDHIYGVCSYGELRCLKLKTGERVWQDYKPITGKSERWGHAFLTPNQDRWFLFNELGELVIGKLSPKGFEEIDRAKLIDPSNRMAGRPVVWSHPAYANQKIFVRNDKELKVFSLAK
jgi:outer membrane protein assembly factor BamB